MFGSQRYMGEWGMWSSQTCACTQMATWFKPTAIIRTDESMFSFPNDRVLETILQMSHKVLFGTCNAPKQ